MENIIHKIREIYPVSDEALQALQANMELRYYPKDTYIVQSGVTDRLVYFIEEGIARSYSITTGRILLRGSRWKATLRSAWIRSTISNRRWRALKRFPIAKSTSSISTS